jgi:hypothetical protein
LMKSLEEEHFGLAFGLFMHYDMRLTMCRSSSRFPRWRRRSTTTTPTGTCRSPCSTTPSSRMKS